MATPSGKVAQMLAFTSSMWGLNREAHAALFRVKTRLECPEGNMRELMRDTNSNWGIAREGERERERERERELSHLRHCRPAHRIKDWLNTRGELASSGPAYPLLEAEKQAGNSQSQKGAILAPEMASSIKLQACSQLLTKFSWDPGWLTSTRRIAARDQLPRRDTGHTWDGTPTAHPGNWVAGTGEVIRRTAPGECVLAKHLVVWAAQTWEGHKSQAQPSLHVRGVPEKLNLSSLDLGSACNPGPALDSSLAEQPGAWAV